MAQLTRAAREGSRRPSFSWSILAGDSAGAPGAEVFVLQRIVIIVIVLVVVWRIAIGLGRRRRETGFGADSYSRFSPLLRRRRREWTTHVGGEKPDHLVACQRCGTYVPSRRALTAGSGEVFCCPGCRDRVEAAEAHDA